MATKRTVLVSDCSPPRDQVNVLRQAKHPHNLAATATS